MIKLTPPAFRIALFEVDSDEPFDYLDGEFANSADGRRRMAALIDRFNAWAANEPDVTAILAAVPTRKTRRQR